MKGLCPLWMSTNRQQGPSYGRKKIADEVWYWLGNLCWKLGKKDMIWHWENDRITAIKSTEKKPCDCPSYMPKRFVCQTVCVEKCFDCMIRLKLIDFGFICFKSELYSCNLHDRVFRWKQWDFHITWSIAIDTLWLRVCVVGEVCSKENFKCVNS